MNNSYNYVSVLHLSLSVSEYSKHASDEIPPILILKFYPLTKMTA